MSEFSQLVMSDAGVTVLIISALLTSFKRQQELAAKTTYRNNLDAGMSRLNPLFKL
ncbi:hypothetical protein [Alteromonas stellipolaris]|uniref:hypothetical protein n=1 Tax=Alteromonas stellipolaris TaxID=233316 RepID=UPI000AF52EAF|nr:hypothetical protein [Alteromonas stellipolaris]